MRDAADEPVEGRDARPGVRDDGRRAEADGGRPADGPAADVANAAAADAPGADAPEGEAPAEDAGDEDIVVRDPVSAPDAQGRPRRATRRFPLFTRDTARPEGGGRAAAGDAPAPARQWPILAVLVLVGLGLLLTASDLFRLGTLLVGVALLTGAVLRWVVPDVGMLAVRSRFTDIVTYGVLGTGIVVLALMVQPDPKLQIPFLKDLLHFTVSG
ncbi:DUF3017 domain-containing protein [Streptomyces sp. enrichment culture]|uniref:DUF3017 domain-containing protein n=1 Tax=Streptomyces sp. enrichment culture TaxID=1795815 RepID=UPI003F569A51